MNKKENILIRIDNKTLIDVFRTSDGNFLLTLKNPDEDILIFSNRETLEYLKQKLIRLFRKINMKEKIREKRGDING